MPKHVALHGTWEVRFDLECLLCTRKVATVQGPTGQPFVPTSIRVQRREHADAVQRLRCPFCSGWLLCQNRERVYVHASQRQLRIARVS